VPTGSEPRAVLPIDGTWIVVPAYQEATRIGGVIDRLLERWRHVVVVDDGSEDGTAGEALKRPVWVLRHVFNLGQGAALETGIRFALARGARYLVTFDADGQHQVEDVASLLAPLVAGDAEFALGSRFLGEAPGIPWTRRLTLKAAILFTRLLSGAPLTDVHNGLRAFTARGARCLHLTLNRMEHASQIIDQIRASRLPFREVPVCVRYTAESMAKGQRSLDALRLAARLVLEKISR
jgi:glycosyltransferase involved in cell wall biosynthesis